MLLLPFPMSANLEGELSEHNPLVKILRSRVAALLLTLVALLNPVESYAQTASVNCVNSSVVCLDSTPCKTIQGVNVCLNWVNPLPAGASQSSQSCWSAQGTYNCLNPALAMQDTCGQYKSNPICGIVASNCVQTDPNSGQCTTYTDTYQCQDGGGVAYTNTDCSGQTYCSNGNCFSKKDKPNSAIVKVIAGMEVARQAGFYMDPNTLTVFHGSSGWCTQNTMGLANCCKPDSKGMSFTNAVLVDELIKAGWNSWVRNYVGSSYTFDTLFDEVDGYVHEAINGMEQVTNTEVTGGYTGQVTNQATGQAGAQAGNTAGQGAQAGNAAGATQPTGAATGGMVGGTIGQMAGSSLAAKNGANTFWTGAAGAAGYAAGTVAGTYAGAYIGTLATTGSFASASGAMSAVSICWPCIIAAVIIMIIMALLACDKTEVKTQLKLGAKLCHEVGSYCSANSVLGCATIRHEYCCFNSKLARIVNEQGRPQIGKSWGDPQNPDCTGFTLDQLQSLDFSKMDLSEFISDVVAMSTPDPNQLAQNIGSHLTGYYGNTSQSNMNGVIPGPQAGVPTPLTVTQNNPPAGPPMPACTWVLSKVAPNSMGDQTGTFTVSSCLAGGSTTWNYIGNCPALQGNSNPPLTQIDANGNTTWTTVVPNSCLNQSTSPTAQSFVNQWKVMVSDPNAGLIGSFQTDWQTN